MIHRFSFQLFLLAFASAFIFSCSGPVSEKNSGESAPPPAGFVIVQENHFELNGKPYYYLGTNFWYAMNLGSNGPGGDRKRLIRELDRLDSMGVNNLRICAGSEGPDTEPWRMTPSFQYAPGKFNSNLAEGLDFVLSEMAQRDMKAIMCLNNFWPWSGGMGQYLVWAGAAETIPYPPPQPGGSWTAYPKFVAQFYSNKKAIALFENFIRQIVTRKNTISGLLYKDDPTIMAWELANEPRGVNNKEAFHSWIDETAGLIKQLDPQHLVTTGSEGLTSDQETSGTDLVKDHNSKFIDYATIHLWVQNWEWYDPARSEKTYPIAVQKAFKYLNDHIKLAKELKKPLVLEEFGISRNQNNHAAGSPVSWRDKYYSTLFNEVYNKSKNGGEFAGCNFWAWGGEGRPRKPGGFWKAGDDFVGDPPHETQGWYSVYDTDTSTIAILKNYSAKFELLNK